MQIEKTHKHTHSRWPEWEGDGLGDRAILSKCLINNYNNKNNLTHVLGRQRLRSNSLKGYKKMVAMVEILSVEVAVEKSQNENSRWKAEEERRKAD